MFSLLIIKQPKLRVSFGVAHERDKSNFILRVCERLTCDVRNFRPHFRCDLRVYRANFNLRNIIMTDRLPRPVDPSRGARKKYAFAEGANRADAKMSRD